MAKKQIKNQKEKEKRKKIIFIIIIVIAAAMIPFVISVMSSTVIVSGQLNNARKGTFADNSLMVISAVKNDFIMSNYDSKQCYNLDKINSLIEKDLIASPFGSTFSNTSYATVEKIQPDTYITHICLVDDDGNGIAYINGDDINPNSVTTDVTCTLPPECN